MINQQVSNIKKPGINEYKVLLRSKGTTHMTLLMYATSREVLVEQLGSRLITLGDVVIMMGNEIDDITVVKNKWNIMV